MFGRISNNIPENDVGVCRNIELLSESAMIEKVTKTFTILTEEVPSHHEIRFIIEKILYIEPPPQIQISPMLNGEWKVPINTSTVIVIKLFKGKSSCVDYLVFDGHVDDHTNAGNAICILESTKTTNQCSRNTAVYQRITKFLVYDKIYPTSPARKIMFYNQEWTSKKNSDTCAFGLALMKSLNIEAYHVKHDMVRSATRNVSHRTGSSLVDNLYEKYAVVGYETIPEMMHAKNKMKDKTGNTSIKIRNEGDNYYISCKLDKGTGTSSGKISHDPNVGILCGLLNYIHSKNPRANFIIQRHNIYQSYFDKFPRSKFWYAIHGIPITFENIQQIQFPLLPTKYFELETKCTEKLATILCTQVATAKGKGNECIFSNISGCALSNIKTTGMDITVERTMPRPDTVYHNEEKNELFIVEGKIEKDIPLGITQLKDKHLDRFVGVIQKEYPKCTIKKGLCITIDRLENLQKYQSLEFPVVFALDGECMYYSLF